MLTLKSRVHTSKKPKSKMDARVASVFTCEGVCRATLIALSAFPYSATARTIKPLPFALGRFANDANETAEKASDIGDSRDSDLMMGSRKSKAPLASGVRVERQKFVIKKHGAWSSTGKERDAGTSLFNLLVDATIESALSSGL